MMGLAWRSVVALVAIAVAVVVGIAASRHHEQPSRVGGGSKSYGLPSARVNMTLRADGSIDVVERITFDFRGSFQGAYRDIPVRAGDLIENVSVCASPDLIGDPDVPDVSKSSLPCPEGTEAYGSGGPTELGSTGTPGTFGTKSLPISGTAEGDLNRATSTERIVWHYRAKDRRGEFVIRYRASGWIRRMRGGDRLLLAATPWGDEWGGSLERLEVTVAGPKGADAPRTSGAWIVPRGAARVERGPDGAASMTFSVIDIEPAERVELLAVLPRAAGVRSAGLPQDGRSIASAAREGREAQTAARDRSQRRDQLNEGRVRLTILAAVAGLGLGLLLTLLTWAIRLRDPRISVDPSSQVTQPPSRLTPAEAACLVDQYQRPPDRALVATIFDLIRRGAWTVVPAQGTKRGTQADIALKKIKDGTAFDVTPWEARARTLVNIVIEGQRSGVALGEFRASIRESPKRSNKVAVQREQFFVQTANAVAKAGWFERPMLLGLHILVSLAAIAVVIGAVMLLGLPGMAWKYDSDPRIVAGLGALVLAGATAFAAPILVLLTLRPARLRYTQVGARDAAAWRAYRRYLDEYGHMGDEQTASIELWEQHLVYAIAFGCADAILDAVRPDATRAGVGDNSSFSNVTPGSVGGLSSGVAAGSFASSGSGSGSSGGGSSSGDSSGGGGGGGGGAW